MEQRQASCAERIGAHYDGRLSTIRALMRAAGGQELEPEELEELEGDGLELEYVCDVCSATSAELEGFVHDAVDGDCDGEVVKAPAISDVDEWARERLEELPLGVSVKRVLRVDLSTGGPGDWFEVEIGDDGELESTPTYHFNDWFDHAERPAHDDEVSSWLEELGQSFAVETVR